MINKINFVLLLVGYVLVFNYQIDSSSGKVIDTDSQLNSEKALLTKRESPANEHLIDETAIPLDQEPQADSGVQNAYSTLDKRGLLFGGSSELDLQRDEGDAQVDDSLADIGKAIFRAMSRVFSVLMSDNQLPSF